jgi:flagellar biosynthesis/type III secretory pathway protein FliH
MMSITQTSEGLAEAACRIVKTLPEEWRATIKSVQWEAEAAKDQLRKRLMDLLRR